MSTDRFQGEHMRAAFEFRQVMGQPIYTADPAVIFTQSDLIEEELKEFQHEAIGSEAELKELADLVYVCFQYAATLGYDLDEALRRVHQSNLSKLVDGKPLRREDGKVLKGPNYQPPSLQDLIQ